MLAEIYMKTQRSYCCVTLLTIFPGFIALRFLCNLSVPVESYLDSAHVHPPWPLCPGPPCAAWSSNVNVGAIFVPVSCVTNECRFPRANGNLRNYAAIKEIIEAGWALDLSFILVLNSQENFGLREWTWFLPSTILALWFIWEYYLLYLSFVVDLGMHLN